MALARTEKRPTCASRAPLRKARVVFIQATDAGAYPPLLHASTLMADAGWDVTFLSAPIAACKMVLPSHPRIEVRTVAPRLSHVMGKRDYLRYMAAAARLAASLQPTVVYASDPLGAAPGWLASRISDATLLYHEHDTPAAAELNSMDREGARGGAARREPDRFSQPGARAHRSEEPRLLTAAPSDRMEPAAERRVACGASRSGSPAAALVPR